MLIYNNWFLKINFNKEEKMKTKRILVVDDEESIRNILKKALQDYYEVETCENGQEALTRIEAGGMPLIDLILTDLQMPIIKGTALVAIAFDLGIPSIIISGCEEPKNHRANYYIKKPFDLKDLYIKVASLL